MHSGNSSLHFLLGILCRIDEVKPEIIRRCGSVFTEELFYPLAIVLERGGDIAARKVEVGMNRLFKPFYDVFRASRQGIELFLG